VLLDWLSSAMDVVVMVAVSLLSVEVEALMILHLEYISCCRVQLTAFAV